MVSELVRLGSEARAADIVSNPETLDGLLNVLRSFPLPFRVRLLNEVAVVEIPWAPPPKMTVPVPAVKTRALPFHADAVDEFTFKKLELPSNEPDVRVTSPVKVWVPEYKSSVPVPVPLIVSPPPVIFPLKVAVPLLLVIETRPVVEKFPMLCVAVPVMVTGELPAVSAPPFTKLPKKVRPKLPVTSVPPELMFKATGLVRLPIVFAPVSVMAPGLVPLIITPPEPVNVAGHSGVVSLTAFPALY